MRVGVTLAGLVMVLVLAGCGEPSPEDRYAESVCSVLLVHRQELLDTYQVVNDTRAAPGEDGRDALLGLALRGGESTWKLRRELRALTVPDSVAASDATGYIQATARSADAWVAEEVRQARRLPKSITLVQSIHGLDRLEMAVMTAFLILRSYDIVEVRVPEIWGSFEKAEKCKELSALGYAPRD